MTERARRFIPHVFLLLGAMLAGRVEATIWIQLPNISAPKTVAILTDRGRAFSDDAVDGVAGYSALGTDGAEGVKDLITKFDPAVADDATESVGEAVSKTYSNEIRHAPGGPYPNATKFDPHGKHRVQEAIDAARGTLHPDLRNYVTPHIGPSGAFKSMEEFEALRFMKAENLRTDQVTAMIAIRNAIPNPTTGTAMQKVI